MPNIWLESALSLVFPSVCEICGHPRPAGHPSGPCGSCFSKSLPAVHAPSTYGPLHYDRLMACRAYSGVMKELLHRYKFNGRKSLKEFLSGLLAETLATEARDENFDAIVAVPASRSRLNERGYNPAELVAGLLAKKISRPHLSRSLCRRAGLSQTQMNKHERRINVENRFFTKASSDLVDKHLLLVDDIVTTGHTVSECARVLKEAGARRVTVLALARGA